MERRCSTRPDDLQKESSDGVCLPRLALVLASGACQCPARQIPWGDDSTSRPETWKAHGPADRFLNWSNAKPRSTGLFQPAFDQLRNRSVAGLKRPSSRRKADDSLGRRNTVPAQSAKARYDLPKLHFQRMAIRHDVLPRPAPPRNEGGKETGRPRSWAADREHKRGLLPDLGHGRLTGPPTPRGILRGRNVAGRGCSSPPTENSMRGRQRG
jgi:hypothetical protein